MKINNNTNNLIIEKAISLDNFFKEEFIKFEVIETKIVGE